MMTSVQIGIVLPEYSSPTYGTSGFGTVQSVYTLCPFETQALTWKQALFDGQAKAGYPNFTWNLGLANNGSDSLFFYEGQTLSNGQVFRMGDWIDKGSYLSFGLMGIHFQSYANAVVRRGYPLDTRLLKALELGSQGILWGGKSPSGQGINEWWALPLLMNAKFPNLVTNELATLKALPSTDGNSPQKLMQDMGPFGFAWYDDGLSPDSLVLPPKTAKMQMTKP